MPPSGRHHEAQRDPSSPHTNGPTIHKTCKWRSYLLVFPDQVEGQSYRVGMQLGRRGQKKFSIFISLALACHGVGRVLHVPTRPSSPAEMMTAAPQARDGQAETRAISKLMQKAAELAEQRARSGDQTEWHGRQGETREAAAEQQACATGAAERRVAAPRREHGARTAGGRLHTAQAARDDTSCVWMRSFDIKVERWAEPRGRRAGRHGPDPRDNDSAEVYIITGTTDARCVAYDMTIYGGGMYSNVRARRPRRRRTDGGDGSGRADERRLRRRQGRLILPRSTSSPAPPTPRVAYDITIYGRGTYYTGGYMISLMTAIIGHEGAGLGATHERTGRLGGSNILKPDDGHNRSRGSGARGHAEEGEARAGLLRWPRLTGFVLPRHDA